jgi:hypothetical protein
MSRQARLEAIGRRLRGGEKAAQDEWEYNH